jgi:predicted  nucleic acid-binding Zn-ribbon protein
VKETLSALVEVQKLDERLAVLRRRLDSLPVELGERESRHAVKEAECEAVAGRRKTALLRCRELENEVRAAEQRVDSLEQKARSLRDAGAVQVAQHEAQELRDKISRFQDEELQLLEDVDRLAADGEEARARLAEEAAELEQFRAAVEADAAELRGQVEEMVADRTGRLSALPSQAVDVYEQMLEKRKGRAMAPLKGSSCGGCGMAVPPNDCVAVTGGSKLVRCRSCLRILVGAEIWSPPQPAAEGEE